MPTEATPLKRPSSAAYINHTESTQRMQTIASPPKIMKGSKVLQSMDGLTPYGGTRALRDETGTTISTHRKAESALNLNELKNTKPMQKASSHADLLSAKHA
jgi:hypothetical protein